jgi:hypothetical protein
LPGLFKTIGYGFSFVLKVYYHEKRNKIALRIKLQQQT